MEALYAFSRHTDDLGDSQLPVPQRAAALERWRRALDAALSAQAISAESASAAAADADDDGVGRQILPALADTVARFGIPRQYLYAAIEGQEMDLVRCRYETFEELTQYCEKVASAVGLACIYIWGFRSEAALEPARQCGIAFQLTNILRDLREDAAMGRVYLPLADLRSCGYAVEDLQQGVAGDAFGRLLAMETARAESFYAVAQTLTNHLAPDGRRVFGMMNATYHRLLRKIARSGEQVLRERIRVTRREKLCLAARWALCPPKSAGR
jgi:phytoene synthase